MNEGRKIRPKSQIMMPSTSPVGRRLVSDSLPRYENEREIREREVIELRQQIAQMEKTMRWWSDCTTNWREKWSQVKFERNQAREELKSTKSQMSNLQKEVEMMRNGQGTREQSSQMFSQSKRPPQRKKTQTEEVTILDEETLATFEERISRLSFKLDESRAILADEREEKAHLLQTIERLERDLSDLHELYESVKKELCEINGKDYGESELDSFGGERDGSEIEEMILEQDWFGRNDISDKPPVQTIEVCLPVNHSCHNLVSEMVITTTGDIIDNDDDGESLTGVSTEPIELDADGVVDNAESVGTPDGVATSTEPELVEKEVEAEIEIEVQPSKTNNDSTEDSAEPIEPIVKESDSTTTPLTNGDEKKTESPKEDLEVSSTVNESSVADVVVSQENNPTLEIIECESKPEENGVVSDSVVPSEETVEVTPTANGNGSGTEPSAEISETVPVGDIVPSEDILESTPTVISDTKKEENVPEKAVPEKAVPKKTSSEKTAPEKAAPEPKPEAVVSSNSQKKVRVKSAKSQESRIPLKKFTRKGAYGRSKSQSEVENLDLPSTVL